MILFGEGEVVGGGAGKVVGDGEDSAGDSLFPQCLGVVGEVGSGLEGFPVERDSFEEEEEEGAG